MGAPVIQIEGVGKRYRLGEYHGGTDLRETIARAAWRVRHRARPDVSELWSLRDLTLTVHEGEALGIVGANGAGKSTLLKIVSNITTPTEGRCRTRGRIGSLLEVGTGFHGDLTGIENAYLSGAILGMSRRDVTRRMDEIVAFAGLEGFMDTPVKRYSSGMYLRLGFAVAAHLDVDILVVDEVLAVGDAEFQRRCLGKLSEVERSGRTVLFVSHNLDALSRLCPVAIWLDGGRLRSLGPTNAVISEYLGSSIVEGPEQSFDDRPALPAQVRGVAVVDSNGIPTDVLTTREQAWVQVDVTVTRRVPGLDVGVLVSTIHGTNLLDEAHSDGPSECIDEPQRYRLRCPLPPVLVPGEYVVGVWLGTAHETIESRDNALRLFVHGDDGGRPQRLLKLGAPWEVEGLT